jgi:hypothetical protein
LFCNLSKYILLFFSCHLYLAQSLRIGRPFPSIRWE